MSSSSFPQPPSDSADPVLAPPSLRWTQIAVSSDMMSRSPEETRMTVNWNSSIAVFVAESPTEDPCEKISYLKVSITISGIQHAENLNPDARTIINAVLGSRERALDFETEYLGCYGVLLRVAVYPEADVRLDTALTPTLARYPHIVDFEPKRRDLYQASSIGSEILTGSSSQASVDITSKSIQSTEFGISASAGYGKEDAAHATVSANAKWNQSQEQDRSSGGNAGITSQNKIDTTANISQLYTTLTGYHSGTNVAHILMLPRPHTEQPVSQDQRTFVPGLRLIEGIQEFVFVVARPTDSTGFRSVVTLDTAHLSEHTRTSMDSVTGPSPSGDMMPPTQYFGGPFDADSVSINVPTSAEMRDGVRIILRSYSTSIVAGTPRSSSIGAIFTVPDGFEIDTSRGDLGHPGISRISETGDTERITSFDYYAIDPQHASLTAAVQYGLLDSSPFLLLTFTLFLRPSAPITPPSTSSSGRIDMLVAERTLDVRYTAGDNGCPLPTNTGSAVFIAHEAAINSPMSIGARLPSYLRQTIQKHLQVTTTVSSSADQQIFDLSKTDYFKNRLLDLFSHRKEILLSSAASVKSLHGERLTKTFGEKASIQRLLVQDLYSFSSALGISLTEAAEIRFAFVKSLILSSMGFAVKN
jgi:hypothetical protein